MNEDKDFSAFDEYLKQGEGEQHERAANWQTAIGLQAVDGLQTSEYLRAIGFEVDNRLFAHHSWYFRNALVRANYKNVPRGVDYDYSFLEKFFRNLLLGEKNALRNRELHIEYAP